MFFLWGFAPCEKSLNDGISEHPFSSVGFCRRFPRQKSTGWNMQAGFVKRTAKLALPGAFWKRTCVYNIIYIYIIYIYIIFYVIVCHYIAYTLYSQTLFCTCRLFKSVLFGLWFPGDVTWVQVHGCCYPPDTSGNRGKSLETRFS